jgi:hypothetical protein
MIELSASGVFGAPQGGLWMVARSSSSGAQVTPAQVWPALSLDVQTRVIALLAQLALSVVAARSSEQRNGKEASCAGPTTDEQNPS